LGKAAELNIRLKARIVLIVPLKNNALKTAKVKNRQTRNRKKEIL